MPRLNPRMIPVPFREKAQQDFENGDVLSVFCKMSNEHCLEFVDDNIDTLKEAGLYEQALVEAFTATRTNNVAWTAAYLRNLFMIGDRHKFRKVGSPMPVSGALTIYRGVAGHGRLRRHDGGSWTSEIDAACWFAVRLGLANPAILTATVDYAEVLCHRTDRGESEFIVWPEKRDRVKMPLDEMKRLAKERTRRDTEDPENILSGLVRN